MNNTIRIDKSMYIGIIVLAFIVTFSSTYNPLNFRRMHVDSSVYISVARGIISGQLPYKDFVDNKGPLAYFLSVPGLFFGGFTGVWITEFVLMIFSVLFSYKTALFFADKYKAFMGTVLAFVILNAFFTVYAGTEEYSLPFLMASIYLFTKYFFAEEKNPAFIEIAAAGFCFSSAVLIRLNMFPLWLGFCAVIMIEMVIQRRFLLLTKYILIFCLGAAIIIVPVLLYLVSKNIFSDFLEQVIAGGASRGFSGFNLKNLVKNYYTVVNRNFSFLPLAVGLYWIITGYKSQKIFYYTAYVFSFLMTALFLSISGGGAHYNIMLIPFIVPAAAFIFNRLYSAIGNIKHKNAIAVLFFCVLFSEGLLKYVFDLSKIIHDTSGKELIETGKTIDENTKPEDMIISLGFNAYIYPFTKRKAATKYIYQGSGVNQIAGAKEKFIRDITTKKPAIIIVFSAENDQIIPEWHTPIFEMIKTDYHLLSDKNNFELYKRNAN